MSSSEIKRIANLPTDLILALDLNETDRMKVNCLKNVSLSNWVIYDSVAPIRVYNWNPANSYGIIIIANKKYLHDLYEVREFLEEVFPDKGFSVQDHTYKIKYELVFYTKFLKVK